MNIAFLAHDKKKELMIQFCTAYKSVLAKHSLYATATTGKLIADHTGLPVTLLLSYRQGGHQHVKQNLLRTHIHLRAGSLTQPMPIGAKVCTESARDGKPLRCHRPLDV